ncbi:GNAT family N-acetyltransferase, partial [Escherichia sp. TWPC-MK]
LRASRNLKTHLLIEPNRLLILLINVGRMLVEHALSMAPELTTNVNEQNEQAVGFYKKVGFKVTGRSEVDDLGKPYPLLNLAYVGE